ncbi:MAG: hypothetical protein ABID38_01385 [Candidatus Diapherotrites archaeon]
MFKWTRQKKRRFSDKSAKKIKKAYEKSRQRVIDAEESERLFGTSLVLRKKSENKRPRRLGGDAAEAIAGSTTLAHYAKLARQKVRQDGSSEPRKEKRVKLQGNLENAELIKKFIKKPGLMEEYNVPPWLKILIKDKQVYVDREGNVHIRRDALGMGDEV